MTLVQELAVQALTRKPSIELIEFQKQWFTIGQLRHVAERVNAIIDASGAAPSQPVAFLPRNRPAVLAAFLGLVSRGRHIRMIHVYQSPEGIARDIRRLKPAVLVALDQDFSEQVVEVLKERRIAGVALTGMDAVGVPGCESSNAECDVSSKGPQIDLLTSGTTGPPKQFPLSYDFIGEVMVTRSALPVEKGVDPLSVPPAYLYWPFGNFSGLYATLPPMLLGMRGLLADRFNLSECLDYVVRFRPNWLGCPPVGVQMILDADVPAEDLASLKAVSVGAAPLPLTAHRAFEERYKIPLLLSYGATEFGGPVAMMTLPLYNEWGKTKMGSVGRPYQDAQLRVVDPTTGNVLDPGVEGLLEVISPRMGPNWIRTTDLAIIDEDGFVWIRGRADGAIMRGGFKLLPETIESALVQHESIAAAMATGIPDRRLGEVPAVGIVLKKGVRKPTFEELEQFLRKRIAATHIPVAWRFVDALPQTAMMKPDRRRLREMFTSEGER